MRPINSFDDVIYRALGNTKIFGQLPLVNIARLIKFADLQHFIGG